MTGQVKIKDKILREAFRNSPANLISAARDGYIENQRSVTLADKVNDEPGHRPLTLLAENEIRIILNWNAQNEKK